MFRLALIAALFCAYAYTEPIPPQFKANPILCTFCKETVDIIAPELDKSYPEIEKAFLIACKHFFSFLPDGDKQCEEIANKVIKPIKEALEQGVTSEDVCKKILAC
uniref:Saposin-like protein 1 n=1 Tax=Haemonchus contortus TaxID=6289 RepID=E0YDN3_HAECO|nr:saposin-like protein 1 [Haemonchus contortus]